MSTDNYISPALDGPPSLCNCGAGSELCNDCARSEDQIRYELSDDWSDELELIPAYRNDYSVDTADQGQTINETNEGREGMIGYDASDVPMYGGHVTTRPRCVNGRWIC